ncbi:MAG: hypothetical protein PHC89_01160 [Candidatus Pacebacteria bacterium]|nr:hypothetical protein [Candidatus Paceibacterota bacterium]
MKRAQFVTVLGVNNTGKTTQLKLLEEVLSKRGYKVAFVRYPVYDLSPTGKEINDIFRNKNPRKLSPKQIQELCAQNRRDFQPELEKLLEENDFVLTEMYTYSGICFGMADGVPKDELLAMNQGLLEPDISILLDGFRYLEAKEKGYYFEEDFEKVQKTREYHLDFAKELGWKIINSRQSIPSVHQAFIDILLTFDYQRQSLI